MTKVTTLISFDVDGTLEVGQPAGAVSMELVDRLLALPICRVGLTGHWESAQAAGVDLEQFAWVSGSVTFDSHGGFLGCVRAKALVLGEAERGLLTRRRIHVGDTAIERRAAHAAGWSYLDHRVFEREIRPWLESVEQQLRRRAAT